MRALLLALVVLLAALPAAAQEAPPGAVVLVVDSGPARINPERLRRTLAVTLARALVRITDPSASASAGTLTIAHDARARWLVRYDAAGGSASAFADIPRSGLYDVAIAEVARRVVGEVEAQRAAPARSSSAPARADTMYTASADEILDPFGPTPPRPLPDAMYIAWVDEILDPFEHTPVSPHRATTSEVIDPFAPLASRQRMYSEVLDPWGR